MFQQFILLQNLEQDQIDAILSQNDLYKNITPEDLTNLPEVNLDNFVNICNFVDYYQFIYEHEFIENIVLAIFNKNKKVINNLKKISYQMRDKILNHVCIPKMKCRYSDNYNNDNIQHIACYKFFSKNNSINFGINEASKYGNLELVKYLFKIGQKCTHLAIDWASKFGHLDIVKYLFEVQNQDCTLYAICWASYHGHLEVVKYLIEVQNKKYTRRTTAYAEKKVLKYLSTKPEYFSDCDTYRGS